MDNRELALQGIAELFTSVENPFSNFKKERYENDFREYANRHAEAIDAMIAEWQATDDAEAWCRILGEHLADTVQACMDQITKKGKRDQQQLNYNMILVTYVIPVLMDRRNEAAEGIADAVVAAWNSRFGTCVSKSTFEKICEGFHRKLCYITTAVCDSLGKADDCYELNILRDYRDHELMKTPEGSRIVEEYYDIAPTIVTRINKEKNSADLYRQIWNTYLQPCIWDLESGRPDACKARYMDMVMDLKGRYIV